MTDRIASLIRQITPFMHVARIDPAISFLTDVIGFKALYRQPGYAYLQLGSAGLRVLESEEGSQPDSNRGFRYYIDVADVDAVYADLGPKLAALPPGDVVGPIDQPYRQRELIIRAPDGGCLVFGAPIDPPS